MGPSFPAFSCFPRRGSNALLRLQDALEPLVFPKPLPWGALVPWTRKLRRKLGAGLWEDTGLRRGFGLEMVLHQAAAKGDRHGIWMNIV